MIPQIETAKANRVYKETDMGLCQLAEVYFLAYLSLFSHFNEVPESCELCIDGAKYFAWQKKPFMKGKDLCHFGIESYLVFSPGERQFYLFRFGMTSCKWNFRTFDIQPRIITQELSTPYFDSEFLKPTIQAEKAALHARGYEDLFKKLVNKLTT